MPTLLEEEEGESSVCSFARENSESAAGERGRVVEICERVSRLVLAVEEETERETVKDVSSPAVAVEEDEEETERETVKTSEGVSRPAVAVEQDEEETERETVKDVSRPAVVEQGERVSKTGEGASRVAMWLNEEGGAQGGKEASEGIAIPVEESEAEGVAEAEEIENGETESGDPASSTPASRHADSAVNRSSSFHEYLRTAAAAAPVGESDRCSVSSLVSLPEGLFEGCIRHKDGSAIGVVFQVEIYYYTL